MRLVTFRDSPHSTRVGILEGEQVHGLAAETMIEWLNGEGRVRTGTIHPLQDVHLLAPVPTPPSFRDFFSYEEHVAKGFELRGAEIPEAWYEQPIFYFSNPAVDPRPRRRGARARPTATCSTSSSRSRRSSGTDNEIAGFTLLNDWSARDLQIKEMTRRARPREGQGLRHQPRTDARHPRRAALRGRAPAPRGHGHPERRRS